MWQGNSPWHNGPNTPQWGDPPPLLPTQASMMSLQPEQYINKTNGSTTVQRV